MAVILVSHYVSVCGCDCSKDSPTLSDMTGSAADGAILISANLSTDTVSILRTVGTNNTVEVI